MTQIANADLPDLPKRWRCHECGHLHEEDQLLQAPNPFDSEDTLMGCPDCGGVNSFREVCQSGTCENDATSGVPRYRGFRYARLCGTHLDEFISNP